MKCSDPNDPACNQPAVVQVRVNHQTNAICEHHRRALVQRMERTARIVWERGGRANRNLQAVLTLAMQGIEFLDVPSELGPYRTPGGAIPLPPPTEDPAGPRMTHE